MEVRALFGPFVWRGVNIDDVTIPILPRFEDQSHTEGVRTQPGRTRFNSMHEFIEMTARP